MRHTQIIRMKDEELRVRWIAEALDDCFRLRSHTHDSEKQQYNGSNDATKGHDEVSRGTETSRE